MFNIAPIDEREKPRFDAYVDGVLFDEDDELALNLFISGEPVRERASESYKIKADPKFSEIGMVRDRLVAKVHNTPILIVSKKFKDFLSESFQNHAEFFPVLVDQVNKKELKGYYICNLTKKFDCTDYENSILEFEFYNENNEGYGEIYTIESLAIDQSKVDTEAQIFLLDNIKYPVIIVREEMIKEMENRNITGFKFMNPKDFMI